MAGRIVHAVTRRRRRARFPLAVWSPSPRQVHIYSGAATAAMITNASKRSSPIATCGVKGFQLCSALRRFCWRSVRTRAFALAWSSKCRRRDYRHLIRRAGASRESTNLPSAVPSSAIGSSVMVASRSVPRYFTSRPAGPRPFRIGPPRSGVYRPRTSKVPSGLSGIFPAMLPRAQSNSSEAPSPRTMNRAWGPPHVPGSIVGSKAAINASVRGRLISFIEPSF